MKNFYLPTGGELISRANRAFIHVIEDNPHFFKPDTVLKAVYGVPGACIWNGGRVMLMPQPTVEDFKNQLYFYNSRGIAYRFTFTNNQLVKTDAYDRYGHELMRTADNGQNEYLVNDEYLEKCLRKRYPDFKVISSTTKCERDINKINTMTKQYDLVVIDYRDNKNAKFLQQIEDRDKIEILVDPWCSVHCQRRLTCYNNLSKAQREFKTDPDKFRCKNLKSTFHQILNLHGEPTDIERNVLTVEDIEFLYSQGFQHFKIEGRTNKPTDVLLSYIYYMVDERYKDVATNLIFNQMFYPAPPGAEEIKLDNPELVEEKEE